MLALGVDPGTAICGYGLVELKGNHLRSVAYGVIETSPKMKAEARLLKIFRELGAVMDTYKPALMGVEQLFFNRNVTTAIAVGQARGVVLLAAAARELELAEFTPLQVKQSVAGYGRATKEQVADMVRRLLNLPVKPHPDDAADALAVAICTAHCVKSAVWGALR